MNSNPKYLLKLINIHMSSFPSSDSCSQVQRCTEHTGQRHGMRKEGWREEEARTDTRTGRHTERERKGEGDRDRQTDTLQGAMLGVRPSPELFCQIRGRWRISKKLNGLSLRSPLLLEGGARLLL